jgi:hypothetical protein
MCIHDTKLHDILPQPAPPLPNISSLPTVNLSEEAVETTIGMSLPRETAASTTSVVLDTPMNSFGVFHQYYHYQFPNHDPENNLDLGMLSNVAHIAQDMIQHKEPASPLLTPTALAVPEQNGSASASTFYLYPNESSFLLGDWYWNQGSQKSLADFKKLIKLYAVSTSLLMTLHPQTGTISIET